MCTVANSRQPTAPQTPVAMSRRGSTITFSTTLGLAKMLNERGIKAVTPSAVATPCGDRSFSPTATPCNSPDGTPPSSPPPSPPPYNPLKFPGMCCLKMCIWISVQFCYSEVSCRKIVIKIFVTLKLCIIRWQVSWPVVQIFYGEHSQEIVNTKLQRNVARLNTAKRLCLVLRERW